MTNFPHNPQPWPLEKIPALTEQDFHLVLFSLANEIVSAKDPFALTQVSIENFLNSPWETLGLVDSKLHEVTRRFATMFGIEATLPQQGHLPASLAAHSFALWQVSPRVVTFFTSGSTGTPKPCSHFEDHLRQEIIGIAPLMEGCQAARVLVPFHHMYGFTFGLQLPRALGIPISKIQPLPQVVAAQMRPGDLLVGIPHLWKHMVSGTPVNGKGITLLTATAPTPPEVLATLNQWGFRCREMFGASETGAMCWRERPDLPFTLLPHFEREKRESNNAGYVNRMLPNGERRQYDLLDTIEWLDEEHLLPAGRKDSAVQVAGRNVFIKHVTDVLREHKGVQDCTVRLMRHEEGDRLKAFVVPADDVPPQTLLVQLKELCKKRLRMEERPTLFTFGPDLPRSPLGKPIDW